MRRKVLAAACLCAPAFSATALPAGDALQQWKAYAQARMTPRYDWVAALRVAPPSLIQRARDQFATPAAIALTSLSRLPQLDLSVGESSGVAAFAAVDRQRPLAAASVWTADYSATTLSRAVGPDTLFSLSAIVARQRFATPGFGATAGQPSVRGVAGGPAPETSDGYGARLALDRSLADGAWRWNLTMQSRLAMDAFKAYRGVFSEAGDFDVPGFVQTGLGVALSPRVQLSADVQQVFYSDVPAFASAALPTRLLSLLGNGDSPQFAWRDLTVYALEASVADRAQGRWSLRWSSQQSPRPTSAMLDQALSKLYSDNNYALAYTRELGSFGSLRIATSYAPESYFLAASPYVRRGVDGRRQVEFEAQWSLGF